MRFRYMTEVQLRHPVEANPGRVNDRDEEGITLLYVATRCRESLSLVLWLLDEKGANVNATTLCGCSAYG